MYKRVYLRIMMYTFKLNIDWKLVSRLSAIDKFDAAWSGIARREKNSLRHLKDMSTVESVGASTRIEGAKLTDVEIIKLISRLDKTKPEERDQQEVAGYFKTLDDIPDRGCYELCTEECSDRM